MSNLKNSNVQNFRIPGTQGRLNKLISESGLYKLSFCSTKPQARAFTDWVTEVVLPAIRKDGGYIAGEEKVATGQMDEDELVLRAMEVLKRKVERLASENEKLESDNTVMGDELNFVTIQEYAALNHIYLRQSEKGRLAHHAKLIAASQGEKITKSPRVYRTRGGQVIDTEGEPWFVAADVCSILDISNVSKAMNKLTQSEVIRRKLTEGRL